MYKRQPLGAALSYDVKINDSVVTQARNNWAEEIVIPATGEVVIWASTENRAELKLILQAGYHYYIRCGMKYGIMVGRPKLEIVEPSVAKAEIEAIQQTAPDPDTDCLLYTSHPFERRNPHPVEFVEIVRIDPQKSEPFEQRHVIALGLLKDAAVEVHPAHVTIQHSHRTFFLCHIPVMLLSFHPTDVSYRSGPIRRHPPGGTPTQRSIIVLRRFRQQRYAGINPRPPKLA